MQEPAAQEDEQPLASIVAEENTLNDRWTLLQRTCRLTCAATLLLSVQLFGNLYEEIVTNAERIANPVPGKLVGELAFGSPVFFYLPWVPIGIVMVFILAARLRRTGPDWIARRITIACGALLLNVAVKIYLIGWLNPIARDGTTDPAAVQAMAIQWAVFNGIAILSVATTLILILSWHFTVINDLAIASLRKAALRDRRSSSGAREHTISF